MQAPAGSLLEGLTLDERERLVSGLEHRRFPDRAVILAEGDAPREMYIISAGLADVSILDPFSVEHRISTVGPGDSIGEMSLLTGQPVSATVRAASDVEVLVLPDADFDRLVAEFPQLYRNLGNILSTRLARTNRRAVQRRSGRVSLLINQGAPALMGYALACSVAWHSRRPTLFVACRDSEPDPEVRALAEARPATDTGTMIASSPANAPGAAPPGAVLMLARPENEFAPERIRRTIEALRDRYAHVLIEINDPSSLAAIQANRIRLLGPRECYIPAEGDGALYALQGWSDASSRRAGPGPDGIITAPAPAPAEREALERGVLPVNDATGRALGWAARDITNLKVGLALGGGAIKGYAHVGVLQALERWSVPVDYIAGTSIGAAVAAAYAVGFPPATCARILDHVGKRAFRVAVPRHAMLSSGALREGLQRIARDRRIEDLRIPLAVIAADIQTGREVVFKRGLLWPAVLASMAIPGVYPPVPIGNYMLVDGGVVNPVPSDAVSGLGADTVIAVKLARRPSDVPLDIISEGPSGRPPVVIQTLTRAIEIMQAKIVTESAAAATITIEPAFPNVAGWGLRAFSEGRPFVDLGEAAAEEARPRLAAALPWLRE